MSAQEANFIKKYNLNLMSNRLLYKIFLGIFIADVLIGAYILVFLPREIGTEFLVLIFGVLAIIFLGLSIFARFFKKDIYLAVKIIFLIIGAVSVLLPLYAVLDYTIRYKQGSERLRRVEEAERQRLREECERYKSRPAVESKNGQLIPSIPTPPPGCF